MSFQSAQRARTRRRAITFVSASVAVIAAFILLRGLRDEPEPPPVLGTVGDTTGFYEEIGVFEEDTTGNVVTIPEEMTGARWPQCLRKGRHLHLHANLHLHLHANLHLHAHPHLTRALFLTI